MKNTIILIIISLLSLKLSAHSKIEIEINSNKLENKYNSVSGEKDSIINVLKQYYNCATWEDRLKFVLNPDKVKTKMEEYYSTGYKYYEIFAENISIKENNFNEGNIVTAFYRNDIIYLKKVNDNFLVDWEATIGYNPVSLAAFNTSSIGTTAKLRVNGKLSNSFIGNYSNENYYSINLNGRVTPCVYIGKTSQIGIKLFNLLKDGKSHQIIVELKIVDNSMTTAIITSFLSDTWIMP